VVEIFAFLDLDQISADFEIEHFSKVSGRQYLRCCSMGDLWMKGSRVRVQRF